MRLNRSSILFVLAVVGFVVLSMTPRGLALCIGGGHKLAESIAGWCEEHGKHVHPPHKHDHGHGDHHHHAGPVDSHQHEDHPAPCADIPLGLDDCRPQVVKWSLTLMHPALAAQIGPLNSSHDLEFPAREAPVRHRSRDAALTGPPTVLRASLRAVVLII